VDGTGSISTEGGQGNFSLSVMQIRGKTKGSFSYSDSSANLSFSTNKLSNLVIMGNHATFNGAAKMGKNRFNFTVNVTDNGNPGTADVFSISVSTGYSAGGNLTSGNILFH
jgi:hypothetical protein